jgi:hypothetical protein
MKKNDIRNHPMIPKDPVARERALKHAIKMAEEIFFPPEPPKVPEFKREKRLVFNSKKEFDKFYKEWRAKQHGKT